ncbi:hypothetical protein ACIQC7_08775 [Kitasatospora sp. NPDC088556]|uniref:hypothetical protein n=1 Tax=Kitasatospora sp. NPDC088556 TaxID=3364076 RepID=UPI0038149FD8
MSEWWEFTRDDFVPGAEKRRAKVQEGYRRAAEEWEAVGQLILFPVVLGGDVPTVDELIEMMGLEN